MRMQLKQAMGAAAAVMALTISTGAAASPSGTAAVPVSARHATADNRFTELLTLAQVKRDVAWAAVERAWAGQPHIGASQLTDQRALGQIKRQASWKAVHPAAGIATGILGGTPLAHASVVSARHAPGDSRFADLRKLGQVKRDVAWAVVERAWGG